MQRQSRSGGVGWDQVALQIPLAKNRQKYDPVTLSARVYPVSLATLQRPFAAFCDRYLSSRSPPDHLLYQMLKIVPVCGGGSDLISAGSICGRAGRFFLRMIFLTFRCVGSATSSVVVVSTTSSWGASSCVSAIFAVWCVSGARERKWMWYRMEWKTRVWRGARG